MGDLDSASPRLISPWWPSRGLWAKVMPSWGAGLALPGRALHIPAGKAGSAQGSVSSFRPPTPVVLVECQQGEMEGWARGV